MSILSFIKDLFTQRIASIQATHPELKQDTKFPFVVVGEILEILPHPNADRLRLTQVNVGETILKIVCGAPNIIVGQKVPVALIGATLPGNFEIKPATIRGEESFGMICAEDELGLGSAHDGILVLPDTAIIGDFIDNYIL